MSELKAFDIVVSEEYYCEGIVKYRRAVYDKSEADKVIAEKDAEIARLKAIRKVHVEAIESMEAGLQQDEEEILHHKYKRCLAMARWCRIHDEFTQLESERLGLSQRALFIWYRRKAMWWNKWFKHWLQLAEKFKEGFVIGVDKATGTDKTVVINYKEAK